MKFKEILNLFGFFGKFVSSIVNFILLFIVYFVGVGLSALFVRILNKKILDLKKENKKSYWGEKIVEDKKFDDHFRQF